MDCREFVDFLMEYVDGELDADMLEIFEEDFELLQNTIRTLARGQLGLLRRTIGGTRRAPGVRALTQAPGGRGRARQAPRRGTRHSDPIPDPIG